MPHTPGERRLRRPVVANRLAEPVPTRLVRGLRVGLLGGSFNPAHEGHRYVSEEALKQLDLDQLWWLVSPQNPLKARSETAPLALRLERARAVARHPQIRVTDLERRLKTRYTVDTVRRLQAAFATHCFVWLMGADNFATLHRWRQWERIVTSVPIAVFDREPYFYRAVGGVAARRFAAACKSGDELRELATASPPAWGMVQLRTHPASSSSIRARGGWTQPGTEDE
ncbi:MAG: nicotinate-nucleotide adenylyltransferase [Pseudomonadota bacterium]